MNRLPLAPTTQFMQPPIYNSQSYRTNPSLTESMIGQSRDLAADRSHFSDEWFDQEFAQAEEASEQAAKKFAQDFMTWQGNAEQDEQRMKPDQTTTSKDQSFLSDPPSGSFAGLDDPQTERIGSDRILDEALEKSNQQVSRDESDELARTAGTLLESVKHEQSQKFKESNFLSLMRQLRDREVRVEGDKIIDVR